MKKIIFSTVLLSFFSICFAEASDEEKKPGWEGKLSIGFNMTSGNSDAVGSSLGAECKKLGDRHELKLKFAGAYAETESTPSQNRVKLESVYRLLFDHAYIFNENSIFHDGIARIRHRIILSAGPGKYLVKNEKYKLSVDLGFAFVRHAPMGDGGDVDESLGIIPAQEFEWQFAPKAKFREKCSVLIFSDRFERVVVTAEAGLETALNDWLSLNLKVANNYDNEPADDTKSNDFILETFIECRF